MDNFDIHVDTEARPTYYNSSDSDESDYYASDSSDSDYEG